MYNWWFCFEKTFNRIFKIIKIQMKKEKEKNSFKGMFTFYHETISPLVIGAVIFSIGYIFEYDPLIWIGVGIHGYVWFLMWKDF